jgi:hypothetical protein
MTHDALEAYICEEGRELQRRLKDRAKAALKQLKAAGRVASGGDPRFARYAADRKTAEAASIRARARGA